MAIILSLPFLSLYGWLVQYKVNGGKGGGTIAGVALAVASFPGPIIAVLNGDAARLLQPQRLAFDGFSGLKRYRTDTVDDGTLLVSSYSEVHGVSTAYLFDLRSERVLHEWVPPVAAINQATSYHDARNQKRNYRTQHPLLMENGDLIFTSGEGPLVRVNACGELVWTVDRHFHHSIERDRDGNLYVPDVMASPKHSGSATSNGHTAAPMRNDGFAKISADGRILEEWSVKAILERHGYNALLYGVGPFEVDRIHLNDVEPIRETDAYVREGDLVLSLRQLSTVMLYRPDEDRIVWLQTGPWLNQHDVDYQGKGIFTIFGNDVVRRPDGRTSLRGHNTIWRYDQKSGKASPYLLHQMAGINTLQQGLHRVLDNGDVFVEEQEKGQLHRIAADGKVWSYVNRIGDGRIGALHWSRYLTRNETDFSWLRDLDCR